METYLNSWQSISVIVFFVSVIAVSIFFEWKWLNERKKNKK